MDFRAYLIKEAKKAIRGPTYKTFKKNKVRMDPEESRKAVAGGATWAFEEKLHGKPISAISKALIDGKNWYSSHTHRAVSIKPTLKGAIKAFEFIKSTS